MKKNSKLLLTTLVAGCIYSESASAVLAPQCIYDIDDSGRIIENNPLNCKHLQIDDAINLSFLGTINTSENAAINGTDITGADVIFYNVVNANNNVIGLNFKNSDVTFHNDVTANDNTDLGLKFENSNIEFNDDLTAINNVNNNLVSSGTNIIFNNDKTIKLTIAPLLDNDSTITFNGAPTFQGNLGNSTNHFSEVKFTLNDPLKRSSLQGDIYSNRIEFNRHQVGIDNNITLTGTVEATDTIFDLGSKTVTIDGVFNHHNPNGGVVINTTYDGTTAGHFVLLGATDVDLSNATNMTFNVTELPSTPLPIYGQERRIDMFVTNGGNLTFVPTNNVIIDSNNKFVTWTFDPADGALVERLNSPPSVILPEIIGKDDDTIGKNVDTITNNNPNLTLDLTNTAVYDAQRAKAALERLVYIALPTFNQNLAIAESAQVVSNRISIKRSGSNRFATVSDISGIAAGDTKKQWGAWFSPFYGESTQKKRKNIPGFKSKYYGGVFGIDSVVHNDIALGAAISLINTDMNHKDQNSGDKTKINSNILYIYGTYEISDEWFLQNVSSISKHKVKNRELRYEFAGDSIASADYNTNSWSTQFTTAYDYKLPNNMILTPMLGLEYGRTNKISYRETGTRTQNLIVKCNDIKQFIGIIGLELSSNYTLNNGIILEPKIQANFHHSFSNRKPEVDIRQEGIAGPSIAPNSVEPDKNIYNVSLSTNVKHNDFMEYSFDYDCKMADRFIAHQGTIKLRLNF